MIVSDGLRIVTGHGFNFVELGLSARLSAASAPHSMLFHVWTDLGLIGALAVAALVYLAFSPPPRSRRGWRRSGSAALTYVFAMGVFGIAAAQAWWITALALALGAFALVSRGDYKTARPTAPKWSPQ